jgi:hypothetical protein
VIANAAVPFLGMASKKPVLGSIAADVPFYGGYVPQLSQAFEDENDRDARLNTLLSVLTNVGLDQGSDIAARASMAGISAATKKPIHPALQTAVMYGKNYAMQPVMNKTAEFITNNNVGTKTADVIKPVDDLINGSNIQNAYGEVLPLLKAYADSQLMNRNRISSGEALREVDQGDMVTGMLPANVRPAARRAIAGVRGAVNDKVQEVAEDAEGLVSRVKTVGKGIAPFANQFRKIFMDELKASAPMTMTGRR